MQLETLIAIVHNHADTEHFSAETALCVQAIVLFDIAQSLRNIGKMLYSIESAIRDLQPPKNDSGNTVDHKSSIG